MKRFFSALRNVYISLIFAILYMPVAVMTVLSFNSSNSYYKWEDFSLHKYEKLFNNRIIMDAVNASIKHTKHWELRNAKIPVKTEKV